MKNLHAIKPPSFKLNKYGFYKNFSNDEFQKTIDQQMKDYELVIAQIKAYKEAFFNVRSVDDVKLSPLKYDKRD